MLIRVLSYFNYWLMRGSAKRDFDKSELIDFLDLKYKPKSNLERSFVQYQAQLYVFDNRLRVIIISPVLIIINFFIIFILYFIALYFCFKKSPVKIDGIISVLPDNVFTPNVKGKNKIFPYDKSIFFDFQDFKFCLVLYFKYFFYSFFIIKNFYFIFKYSGVQKVFNEILVSNEYSFTSSVLTEYFNSRGMLVSNCMHGEALVDPVCSFCSYNNFYVWDKSYINIFKKNKSIAEFKISDCAALYLKIDSRNEERNTLLYLLQGGESEEQLMSIKNRLIDLKNNTGIIYLKIREHPRIVTEALLLYFSKNEIDTDSLEHSLSASRIVCSRYSTVLFQVYFFKKHNNVNYPKLLIDLEFWTVPDDYIMLDKVDGCL